MRHARMQVLIAVLTSLIVPSAASVTSAAPPSAGPHVRLLSSGLQGGVGSTVGPDGALYVTEAIVGRISRVDPRTGRTTTFASGLPRRVVPGVGGAMDIAFVRHTAYVLVTLVGSDVGGSDVDGIYRVDGPHHFTVVADIGAWSQAHPPRTAFDVPTGVQYAMQPHLGGFLVTDGHHNRVLQVTLAGKVSEVIAFPNIVPTGLAVRGKTVVMAEAGPVPHLPQGGKVVAFTTRSSAAREVASGAPLLVDVEFGPSHSLFALSQGHFTPGGAEGSPADPNTGALERVNPDGSMTPVATGLNQPTSFEIIGETAYVVTLTGEIWRIATVSRASHARR